MSASWGLVRFRRTGNVYMGDYEGTSDIFVPFLCTPEECWDEKWECYSSISYARKMVNSGKSWRFPEDVGDIDICDIYADYGGGMWWVGTGSESLKMLKTGIDCLEEGFEWDDGRENRPSWVDEFWVKLTGETVE